MARAKADTAKKKAPKVAAGPGAESDIYTALLALSFMAMASTSIWVCMKSMAFFGRIF